ncbi:MAG TPA: prepilin peptidase [Vicinamibacterales bacterium]|nr:prepilin peptidase [Vicinamibacterales bacterium]
MTLPVVVLLGVLGLMVGSFLNVCISRLPAHQSIVFPGSRCPKCGTAIRWSDNIPVVSYLLLGARCRACRAPIAVRYPLVEIATAVAFVLQAVVIDDPALLAVRLVFTALLVALFGTDIETQRLPNVLTLPGIVLGLSASVWLPPGLPSAAIGAAIGAAIPWTIRWIWFQARGVEAMGLGDVKMLAMIGAFLGWQQVWLVLLLSSLAGALVGIALTATGHRSMQSRLPFGTFLAAAAFVASLGGENVLDWYLSLFP